MKFPSVAFLCFISLCSILIAVLCESSTDDKCKSLVNSPFNICISAGYNFSFSLPEKLNKPEFEDVLASALKTAIQIWEKCADLNLVVTMECSSTFPKCGNGGKRVLPCKRVCGELLKKCLYTDFRGSSFMQKYMEELLALCLSLPDEEPSDEKCVEPPNFRTNDSIPSPLDRGCQELIIPACKDLGVYSHTHLSEEVQKMIYRDYWGKTYNGSILQRNFSKRQEEILAKYPKCRKNIEKLYCGKHFPPCFLHETKRVLKTPCRSLCKDIARDCPGYFSRELSYNDTVYCGSFPEGAEGELFCDLKEWPSPYYWVNFFRGRAGSHKVRPTPSSTPSTKGPLMQWPTGVATLTTAAVDGDTTPTTAAFEAYPTLPSPPSKELNQHGPKGWAIAVAVIVTLVVVGLVLAGLIWWKLKWRGTSPFAGYQKQPDESGFEL